jgi:hypothetical protein
LRVGGKLQNRTVITNSNSHRRLSRKTTCEIIQEIIFGHGRKVLEGVPLDSFANVPENNWNVKRRTEVRSFDLKIPAHLG